MVLLVARQNGKSLVLTVLSLYFMYLREAALVIGTAQNLDVAEEIWQDAVDIAEASEDLAAEIKQVVKVNGKKTLKLVGGQRYKVAAASRRAPRGLSSDLVMLDELREHQHWQAWAAATKTTMARAQALIVAASNAGDAASVVLGFLRRLGHWAIGDPDGICDGQCPDLQAEVEEEGEDGIDQEDEDSLGIFEWSAAPGSKRWDRDAWAQANPGMGHTITERAIAAAARTDPDDVFFPECLCSWMDGHTTSIFGDGVWESRWDGHSAIASRHRFGLAVKPDRSRTTIAVAGVRADGRLHVEVVQTGSGTRWAPKRVRELLNKWGGQVGLEPSGAAGGLMKQLADEKIEPVLLGNQEMTQAAGAFFDAVIEDALTHLGQPELNEALANAVQKYVAGSKAFRWEPVSSLVDLSPLDSATIAAWLATEAPEPEPEGPNLW